MTRAEDLQSSNFQSRRVLFAIENLAVAIRELFYCFLAVGRGCPWNLGYATLKLEMGSKPLFHDEELQEARVLEDMLCQELRLVVRHE
jgi:hypothetical protein